MYFQQTHFVVELFKHCLLAFIGSLITETYLKLAEPLLIADALKN
jgi:hypothetical protein